MRSVSSCTTGPSQVRICLLRNTSVKAVEGPLLALLPLEKQNLLWFYKIKSASWDLSKNTISKLYKKVDHHSKDYHKHMMDSTIFYQLHHEILSVAHYPYNSAGISTYNSKVMQMLSSKTIRIFVKKRTVQDKYSKIRNSLSIFNNAQLPES